MQNTKVALKKIHRLAVAVRDCEEGSREWDRATDALRDAMSESMLVDIISMAISSIPAVRGREAPECLTANVAGGLTYRSKPMEYIKSEAL